MTPPQIDLTYDETNDEYRLHPSDESQLVTEIVLAIADIEDRDPTEMEPLYFAIGRELLDYLSADRRKHAGDVSFRYAGFRVVVQDGDVVLHPRP